MKWKALAIVSTGAFFVLLLGVLVTGHLRSLFGLRSLDTPALITQVKSLKQLVSVRYTIQRVVGIREPKAPLGEESILLMVQGEALAGVDLDGIASRDVHFSGRRKVMVTLPAAKLFNVFLDEKETKVWDRQITWWTPWVSPDPDLEHKARLEGIDEVRKAALGMGMLEQAQKNAETAIRDLLGAFDIHADFKTRPLD